MNVERCRWAERAITPTDIKKHDKGNRNEEGLTRASKAFNELQLWFVVGEMYSKKEETISRWMRDDEAHDRYFEDAKAPTGIKCLACSRDMFVTHKHLETSLDEPDRVLFMYDCTLDHVPRRAFYDNGEEWKFDAPLCPKCSTALERKDEDSDTMWKSTSTCPNCGHVEVSEIERAVAKEEVPDPEYQKDCERFCSEKEGMKYVEWMRTAKELTAILDKKKEKENNKDLYDAVAKIKRLKIIELEQLIQPILEEANYTKLHFKDPEVARDVVVPFVVHDTKQGREDRASCQDLQKLLKKTLEVTNWRLMSDGVSYRLGMLEGRFRAYEKEEDLVKLVSNK